MVLLRPAGGCVRCRKELVQCSKKMRGLDTGALKQKTYILCACIICVLIPLEIVSNVLDNTILRSIHKILYIIFILFVLFGGNKQLLRAFISIFDRRLYMIRA